MAAEKAMIIAAITTHTQGVNWGQALVTALSIISGLIVVGGPVLRYWGKRRDRNQARLERTINHAVDQFAAGIGVRIDQIDDPLSRHITGHK